MRTYMIYFKKSFLEYTKGYKEGLERIVDLIRMNPKFPPEWFQLRYTEY